MIRKKLFNLLINCNILVNDNNHNDSLNIKTYDFNTLYYKYSTKQAKSEHLQVFCKHF